LQRLDDSRSTSNSTDDLATSTKDAAAPDFARTLAAAQASSRPGSAAKHSPNALDDRFSALISQTAARYGVDEDLVHAVVQAESGYSPRSRSQCGAMGLMQLMPGTARALGVSDPWDPAQNLDGGVRYLRQQLDRFKDVDLAVAAYNAGPGAVQRHDGVPPYHETQGYVKRVMQTLWQRKGQQ
jgi:soluble lytic murein transglycosylase-like protein